MTSTKKVLLGTAAATMAAAAGGMAQAADIMVKKAPPIQYVRICDMYGTRFFQIPGTNTCLSVQGQIQVDSAYQPTKDTLILSQAGKSWNQTFLFANQIDPLGYEAVVKPRMDFRNETSWGTFRAYMEIKAAVDGGNFVNPTGPAGGQTTSGVGIFRGYLQWAGFTVGLTASPYAQGGYNDDDLQNVTTSEKQQSYLFMYTWTPTGPGQPPKKGGAPFPGGWSASIGAESPLATRAKPQAAGNKYLMLTEPGAPSFSLTDGTLTMPDVVGTVHYEGDPTGANPKQNDQFGLATIHFGFDWHQLTTQGVSGVGIFCPTVGASLPAFACQAGPTVHDSGWGAVTSWRFFTPMWGGANTGPIRQPDYIWLDAEYCNGFAIGCGVGGGEGNLSVGDAYSIMGFLRDDTDARWFNNGGVQAADKEKFLVFNAAYHHILTDCTDPVNCWRMNLAYNWARATPGTITENTDWTQGGMGQGTLNRVTLNFIWGANVVGASVPTLGELSFEVQYWWLRQDLPNNCNGGFTACVATGPTPVPLGITQNPASWVGRMTFTRNW
jgi:hypothetical protein